ncbi:hypothetical protein JW968_05170 [Candidatus Woesearchaeota archaeon]|nr:hypothetical protein [Candidatus Woesearchaeota archaeon]
MQMKILIAITAVIILLMPTALAQEECVVKLESYMAGALSRLKLSKDKMCFNMDVCGLTEAREYDLHLMKCKKIPIWGFDEYKTEGQFSRQQLANMLEIPIDNIILLDDPNEFIPTGPVIIAKKGGKYYFGGKETAIIGDPWAFNRLIMEWWFWAAIIAISLFYFVLFPKIKKKWTEYKSQEDETI